jgi:hypothetical protein
MAEPTDDLARSVIRTRWRFAIFEDAINSLKQSIALAIEINSSEIEATALNNIGCAYLRPDQPGLAISHLSAANQSCGHSRRRGSRGKPRSRVGTQRTIRLSCGSSSFRDDCANRAASDTTRELALRAAGGDTIPELSPFPKARENAADQLASPLFEVRDDFELGGSSPRQGQGGIENRQPTETRRTAAQQFVFSLLMPLELDARPYWYANGYSHEVQL